MCPDQILCEFAILCLICATVNGLAGDSSGLISQSHPAAQRFTFSAVLILVGAFFLCVRCLNVSGEMASPVSL